MLDRISEQIAAAFGEGKKSILLTKVLDQMPVGVIIAEAPSGAVVYQNRLGSELIGETRTDIAAIEQYDRFGAIHPDGRPLTADEYPLPRVLSGEGEVKDEEVLYKRPDGDVRVLAVSATLVRSPTGAALAAVATFQDVTALRAAEREARATGERLKRSLEATTDGVLVLDRNWRILFINDRANALVGGGRDLLEQNIWTVFPDAIGSPFWTAYHAALKTNEPQEVEHYFAPLGLTFSARAFPSETALTIFFRDVTEEREAERVRADLTRELVHRIANLFTLVLAMIKLSARGAATKDALAEKLTGRISALAKAHTLVKPSADTGAPPATTTLATVVETVLAPYRDGDAPLELNLPDIPIGAQTASGFALVFHELATNAVKYGALGEAGESLALRGDRLDDDLRIVWTERCVGAVREPGEARGFGSALIESTLRRMKADLERQWSPQGLIATMRVPLETLGR
jgi:PAS domain S-box-containing protein